MIVISYCYLTWPSKIFKTWMVVIFQNDNIFDPLAVELIDHLYWLLGSNK